MNKRMGNNFIINIGRQLGSGGREIGEKLAARLGIDFYDKELIRLALKRVDCVVSFLRKLMRKLHKVLLEGSSACVSLLSVTGLSQPRIA